jgi:hypothetical protein
MSRALPLAGFQVTLIGRIWVIPEGKPDSSSGPLLSICYVESTKGIFQQCQF